MPVATPLALLPSWKQSMLQLVEESRYTVFENTSYFYSFMVIKKYLTVISCVWSTDGGRYIISRGCHWEGVCQALSGSSHRSPSSYNETFSWSYYTHKKYILNTFGQNSIQGLPNHSGWGTWASNDKSVEIQPQLSINLVIKVSNAVSWLHSRIKIHTWQMLLPQGQMVAQHCPDSVPVDVKKVQFSLEVAPQPIVTEM